MILLTGVLIAMIVYYLVNSPIPEKFNKKSE